jgi:hypothetical protein
VHASGKPAKRGRAKLEIFIFSSLAPLRLPVARTRLRHVESIIEGHREKAASV